MQTSTTQAEQRAAALAHYRERLTQGMPLNDDRVELDTIEAPDADDGAARSEWLELLAYDALARDQPGYAFACLESAATLVTGARRESLQAFAQQTLERHFPPFEEQGQAVGAIRAWARAALAARSLDTAAARAQATALKQAWMFRLVHSQRRERRFSIDVLLDRFRLSAKERTIVRILHAVHWDQQVDRAVGAQGLCVGDLLDLVVDGPSERAQWLGCLDGRGPLLTSRLVRLGPPGPLRQRAIDLDAGVVAWLEARDWRSPELGSALVRHQYLEFEPPAYVTPTLDALDASLGRGPRTRTLLSGRSAASRTLILQAWSATRDRPVFQLRHAVSAEDLLAVAREVRLRDGVLSIPARLAPSASQLHALAHTHLIFQADPPTAHPAILDVHALAHVRVPAPPSTQRAELWNLALVDAGLAELDPVALSDQLGELDLDLAEMGLVTSGLVASGARPDQVDVARLARAATTWLGSRITAT